MKARTVNQLRAAAATLCVGVFLVSAWPAAETVVDDAYISARYSDALAHGYGLTYSFGEPAIEGFTNLAWTLLLSLGIAIGVPVHPWMVGLGLLFGALAVVGAMALSDALIGKPTPVPLAVGLWLAVDPRLAVATTNGLESSQFLATVLWSGWAVLAAKGRWRWAAGVLVGLLFTVRPEGIAVAGAYVLLDLFLRRDRLRSVETWAIALPVAGIFAAVTGMRLTLFGDIVPNTFHAKEALPWDQLQKMNTRYVARDRYFWWSLPALAVLGIALPGKRAPRVVLAGIALFLFGLAWTVYLWMPGARLLLPVFALVACVVVAGIGSAPRWVWPLALGLLGIGGYEAWTAREAHQRYDRAHSVLDHNPAQQAARFLRKHLPEGSWVAIRDAGVFPYYIGPEHHVAELHPRALTRPHPDGEAAAVLEYTPETPEVIVLVSNRRQRSGFYYTNDRRIFMRATRQAEYRYLGRVFQHYHRLFDVYVRADLDVPDLPEPLVVNHKGPNPDIVGAR